MPAPFRDALTRFVSSPSRDHFVSRNPSDPLVPSPCNLNHTQQICARNSLNAKEKPVFIFLAFKCDPAHFLPSTGGDPGQTPRTTVPAVPAGRYLFEALKTPCDAGHDRSTNPEL